MSCKAIWMSIKHQSKRKWYFTTDLCTRLKTYVPKQEKKYSYFWKRKKRMWKFNAISFLTFTAHKLALGITVRRVDGTGDGNHYSWTTEARHWNILNTMAAIDLAMQGTRIFQDIVLS